MPEMPLVSIIIPVYNVEKYVGECLNSLIDQTYQKLEIICINDGSQDNSLEVLERYQKKDNRIKVVSQKNQGVSHARNVGIDMSKGEVIFFVDPDDWCDLTLVEKVINRFEKDGSNIVVYGMNLYLEKSQRTINDHPIFSLKNFGESEKNCFSGEEILYVENISGSASNRGYKKELLLKNNLRFVVGRYFEDGIFNLDAKAACQKMSILKENLYFYRLERDGSTTRSLDDRWRDLIWAMEVSWKKMIELGIAKELSDGVVREILDTVDDFFRGLNEQNKRLFFDEVRMILLQNFSKTFTFKKNRAAQTKYDWIVQSESYEDYLRNKNGNLFFKKIVKNGVVKTKILGITVKRE